ncbi:MAG TPA: hypothetical protein VN493_08920 [Thermoanaerobaculia bacterium]|nr:hypothetical protein [Thermoanaerobaculia bacterium]
MKSIERASVLRAGPAMGTWVLFFSVSFMTDIRDTVFLAPLVLPVLLLAVGFSVFYYRKKQEELSGRDGRKLEVACQIGIFLLHYALQNYAPLDASIEYCLLVAYMLFALHVSIHHVSVNAFSGPAILVLGMGHKQEGADSELYAFALLILLMTALLGFRNRRVRDLITPVLGTFFLLLVSKVEFGITTSLIAAAGLLVLYTTYRLVMLARKVNQFSSFLVDLAAAPGAIILARSLLHEPSGLEIAAFLVNFYIAKLIVVLVAGALRVRSDAAEAGGLKTVFRDRMDSPRSIRYNNVWFSLVSSLCALGLSYMHYVFQKDYSLQVQAALLGLTGAALYVLSLTMNRIFLITIGASARRGRLSIGRRFDSKLLRLSALFILATSMLSSLGTLEASSFSSHVHEKVAALDKQQKYEEVTDFFRGAWQDVEQRSLELGTPELTNVFLLFSLSFAVLLMISDGELDRPPFFFFRGLVPFKSLLSVREMRDQSSRLLFNTPFIGPFAKGFNALLEHILRSFDNEVRFSVGKLFIILGSIAYFVGTEDFVDRMILVLGMALVPDLPEAFTPSLRGAEHLVAWKSCLSSSVLGIFLYALGAVFHRPYLRTSAVVIGLCFLGFNLFRLGSLNPFFPVVCASGLIGACYLLHAREEKEGVF